jgi:hypothetical protein
MNDTAPTVRCPICLSMVTLDPELLWVLPADGTDHQRLTIPPGATDDQRRRLLRRAKVLCPNRIDEYPEHHLPYRYVDQRSEPVVVALVGTPGSGKTHLLASMVGMFQQQGLERFGLSVSPLDVDEYELFTNTLVQPLLSGGQVLSRTNQDVWKFALGLMVDDTAAPDEPGRAVAFFDVSGERMTSAGHVAKQAFFERVDGFIFVISADDLENGRTDITFSTVLDLVGDKHDKAAVLVLGKSDHYRFEPVVDRWLREEDPWLSPSLILRETRDLYAFIDLHDKGNGYLRPWSEVGRAAIHAVSATGSARLDETRYARPVRPRRVLQPFLTLMAMTGVKGGDGAQEIGI